MSVSTESRTLTLGHSPDPDDAFMFFALAEGRIETGSWRFEHRLADIETLNRQALAGELDITAVSFHAYPRLADRYALLACGSSMGDGYGPLVVERDGAEAVADPLVAIPGEMTSAHLALRLHARAPVRTRVVAFDRIPEAVLSGVVDRGVLIHEGQLTYGDQGMRAVVDLGVWWKEETGLPLPLGANAVRRDLGEPAITEIARLLRASISYALEHRDEALRYAQGFGRGLDTGRTDRFVGMYVNDLTLDLGERGGRAAREFLARGQAIGMVPAGFELHIVGGS